MVKTIRYLLLIWLILFYSICFANTTVEKGFYVKAEVPSVLSVTGVRDFSFTIKDPQAMPDNAYTDREHLCVYSNIQADDGYYYYTVYATAGDVGGWDTNEKRFLMINQSNPNQKITFQVLWNDYYTEDPDQPIGPELGVGLRLVNVTPDSKYADCHDMKLVHGVSASADLVVKLDTTSVQNASAGVYKAHVILHIIAQDFGE